MGLFRLAAVVAVGVSLLPADPEKQEQLYQRAASAAEWTWTFCDRNAEMCDKAGTLWTDFAAKAQFGAKLAFDMLREHQQQNSEAVADAKPNADPKAPTPTSYRLEPNQPQAAAAQPGITTGTLRPSDMKPAWRGKPANH